MNMRHVGRVAIVALAACLVVSVALVLSGCGSSSSSSSSSASSPSSQASTGTTLTAMLPAAIRSKGEITVGINGIFAPMEYQNPGSSKLIGIDVDFANAIGKALGVKVAYDNMSFSALIPSVTTGRVDMVISGLSDTKAREKTLDFIDYFNTGTQVYTTKANAGTITSLASLSGKTMAISASTDYLTTMQNWSKVNLQSKGLPGIKILAVDSEATGRLQIAEGRAQASAISPEEIGYLNSQSPGQYVTVGPLLNPGPYGICFTKSNTQLRDAVLAAVQQLFANGTYQSILTKWHVTTAALKAPTVNAAVN